MKFILLLFFGCTEISVPRGEEGVILNVLHQAKIPFVPRFQKDLTIFRIYMRDEKRFLSTASGEQYPYTLIRRFGAPVLLLKYRHRVGIIAGMLLCASMLFLAPQFIWEVNYSGLKELTYAEAERILKEEGVCVGSFSPLLDRERVHANVLMKNAQISWVSVNIIGSRANVEIVEREAGSVASVTADGANVLAAKAGQIVDMKIASGRRVSEVGNVVHKGTLLVSGVYDTGKMGTRFVCADAVIYAQVADIFCAKIPLEYTEYRYENAKIVKKSINFFGKTINIFKNYSNIDSYYDILYRKETMPWKGFDRLPLLLESTVAYPYTEQTVFRTEEDALLLAKADVHKQIADAGYKELLSKEEAYTVEDGVLCYRCRVEAIQNIAMVSPFFVD